MTDLWRSPSWGPRRSAGPWWVSERSGGGAAYGSAALLMDRCQAATLGRGWGGVPVIRFRVVHSTVEQVEDEERTMERKYEAIQRNKGEGEWGSAAARPT